MKLLLLAAVLLAGCHEAAAPEARYTVGPGCTLFFLPPPNVSVSDIFAQHFDRCPQVVMDSTRAP